MKVLALIKEVPVVSDIRIDRKTFTVDRSGAGKMMNPADIHAVEAALTAASGPDDEVTVMSMGPESCESLLRDAVSLGAKRAVRITDSAFAGADTLATAHILKAAIDKTGPFDLIFCGACSVDGFTSQIPAKLGTLLGCGILTGAAKMTVTADRMTIERKAGSGYEKLSAGYPLVCSVTEDLGRPRAANIKGRMAAKKLQIEVLDNSILQLDADALHSPSKVLALFPPQKAESREFISGKTAAEKADKLVRILMDNHYV